MTPTGPTSAATSAEHIDVRGDEERSDISIAWKYTWNAEATWNAKVTWLGAEATLGSIGSLY